MTNYYEVMNIDESFTDLTGKHQQTREKRKKKESLNEEDLV